MSTNMTLITSVTVGSGGAASITLPATGTIPQTYTDLKVVISARSSADMTYAVTFNGSTTSYSGISLRGSGSAVASYATSAYSYGSTAIGLGYINDATSTFTNCEIYIPNYTSSNHKSLSIDNIQEENVSDPVYANLTAGLWSNTAAITSIGLQTQSGTFTEGSTFYLYGISNVTSTTKATGGIVSSDGTYNYHMFPYSGTFTPTTAISADVLVIAGGGGGGGSRGAGGGAGGLLVHTSQSLTAQAYTVTVGSGGSAGSGSAGTQGGDGGNSQFGSLTASVGGGGGGGAAADSGRNGGSGGGGAGSVGAVGIATSGQGNNGGSPYANTPPYYSGGGGGAGAVGQAGNTVSGVPGNGGNGINTYSTWAIATQTGANNGYYAGGGGGGRNDAGTASTGGLGGGGNGGGTSNQVGFPGVINTGGGGGAGANDTVGVSGGAGGSGLVIIRYAI